MQLAQLCALLPATQSTLSAPAVTAARQARAQQAAAGADASAWALEARHQQSSAQAQAQQQEDSSEALLLDHEDKALLQEVAGLLQHSGRATAQHTHLHTTGAPAAGKHGAVSSSAQAVIMHLQQRLHVLCLKQRVLNEQLAFLAKCSAAQAKLMTRLATDVLQALSDALGEPVVACCNWKGWIVVRIRSGPCWSQSWGCWRLHSVKLHRADVRLANREDVTCAD